MVIERKNNYTLSLLSILLIQKWSPKMEANAALPTACNKHPGWMQMMGTNDFCYVEIKEYLSWFDAQSNCQRLGGTLASIHTEDENDFINSLRTSSNYGPMWIGLTNKNGEDEYRWTDNSPSNYFNWALGEPNDALGMESCAEITSSGIWNDDHCGKKYCSFCKRPNSDEPLTTAPPTAMPPGHCKKGYSEFQGHCYLIQGTQEGEHKDFKHAAMLCRSLGLGHDLVSVHSDKEMAHLITMMATWSDSHVEAINKTFWIGLMDKGTGNFNPGGFAWTDESVAEYFNWALNQPTNYYNEDCVFLQSMQEDNEVGRWDDGDCNDKRPFICKTKVDPTEPASPPPKCTDSSFDFDSFHGNCYTYVSDSKKTWNDAQKDCKSKGANLISIIDSAEQAYMLNYVEGNVWIGLSNKGHNDIFTWSDDWPVQYINWGKDPDWSEESCVYFSSASGGSWMEAKCDEEKTTYVCKYTNRPLPTPNPEGSCPGGWTDLPGPSCYMFNNNVEDAVSWSDASSECLKMGGNLASIHSDEEMDKIDEIIGFSHTSHWIGLKMGLDGIFYWSDKSAFDFENWLDEPNPDSVVDDNCVNIEFNYGGLWSAMDCSLQSGYICKMSKIHSPPPTAPPSSDTTTQNNGQGLSGGATAAIVIVCLLVVAGSIAGFVYYKKAELFNIQRFKTLIE